ncbi:MAG TPA: GxxExxY protein [Polyangia bacterium]|nr:GxxExxY protein [Polyangia bacterium]
MKRQDAKTPVLIEPDEELDRRAADVVDAAIEVHRVLGPGLLESLYEQALCLELQLRGVPFRRQVAIGITYKGTLIGEHRLDLLVAERLVVELKAVEALMPVHGVQVRSYLKATRCILGLLINFNVPLLKLGIQRIILSYQ